MINNIARPKLSQLTHTAPVPRGPFLDQLHAYRPPWTRLLQPSLSLQFAHLGIDSSSRETRRLDTDRCGQNCARRPAIRRLAGFRRGGDSRDPATVADKLRPPRRRDFPKCAGGLPQRPPVPIWAAGTMESNSQRPFAFRNRPSLLDSGWPSLGQRLAQRQGRAGRPQAPQSASSSIYAFSKARHPSTSSTPSTLSSTHHFVTLIPFLFPATMTIPFPTFSTQSTARKYEQFGTYSSIPHKTYTPDAPKQCTCHEKTRHKSQ